MADRQLIERMKANAETVQVIVKQMPSLDDAFRYTVELTQQQAGNNIAAIGFKPEALETLRLLCTVAGLNLLDPPLRPNANEIHSAVTPADWGIAETGTLVIKAASEEIRLATMLAETHIALLPASRIMPDAETLEKDLDGILKTEPASYLTFITGASRTADIERVLAIGVHGPQELHILIME